MMTAFRRFDPYGILNQIDRERQTLAALAGTPAEIESEPDSSVIRASNYANKIRTHRGAPAKVANPAKPDASDAETLATLATLAAPELEISPQWGEAEEHRAALVEHDGNIPRAWAEGFARLDPNRPPADVPTMRWRRFVGDVGRFLDGPFCTVAATLGWGPFDLFGCHRARPFARIDQAGLLWLLNGHKLIALTENTATIETRAGARQTYRRKPSEPGRVLSWEFMP
jgi:hypothetical protein